MWEQVVVRFNVARSRGSPDRDLKGYKVVRNEEALRQMGGLWSHATRVARQGGTHEDRVQEGGGGGHTTHDGLDDEELLLYEQLTSHEGIEEQDADDHEHSTEREEDAGDEPEYGNCNETQAGDDFGYYAQQSVPSSPHERVAGSIMTGGPIDVSMGADYPFTADDATNAA